MCLKKATKIIFLRRVRNVFAELHILYQPKNMTKRLAFLLCCCAVFLFACRNGAPGDLRGYYFPLKSLQEGMVYEYRAKGELTPVYWYYRSVFGPEGRFLTATYYEQELEPLQFVREKLVSNGMLLKDLRIYTADESGVARQTPVQIEHGNTFPFKVTDSLGVFLYKVHWTEPSGEEVTVTRNRRFAGDTTFVFQGKNYPGILFSTLEAVALDHPTQGFFEQQLQGREGYAKGLGMVFFEKGPIGTPPIAYYLHDRYAMERLEEKARKGR